MIILDLPSLHGCVRSWPACLLACRHIAAGLVAAVERRRVQGRRRARPGLDPAPAAASVREAAGPYSCLCSYGLHSYGLCGYGLCSYSARDSRGCGSVPMSVHMPVLMSIHTPILMSIHTPMLMSVHTPVLMSIHTPVLMSTHMPVLMSIRT